MEEYDLQEAQRAEVKRLRKIKKCVVKAGRKTISTELKLEIPVTLRLEIEEKHNSKCKVCKRRPGKLQIHHINLNNEDNSLTNLELLCQKHHAEKHKRN